MPEAAQAQDELKATLRGAPVSVLNEQGHRHGKTAEPVRQSHQTRSTNHSRRGNFTDPDALFTSTCKRRPRAQHDSKGNDTPLATSTKAHSNAAPSSLHHVPLEGGRWGPKPWHANRRSEGVQDRRSPPPSPCALAALVVEYSTLCSFL